MVLLFHVNSFVVPFLKRQNKCGECGKSYVFLDHKAKVM